MLLKAERRQALAILEAFAPAPVAPTNGACLLVPNAGEVDYLDVVDKMMTASGARARLGIHLALLIATFAPLWMCGRFRTMRGLRVHERCEILSRLLRHRVFFIRELSILLKIAASMALLGTPSLRARSNYDRPRGMSGAPAATRNPLSVLRASRPIAEPADVVGQKARIARARFSGA